MMGEVITFLVGIPLITERIYRKDFRWAPKPRSITCICLQRKVPGKNHICIHANSSSCQIAKFVLILFVECKMVLLDLI